MTVLFLCRQNACRSQMAQAFFERMTGTSFVVVSGGSSPAHAIHPVVMDAMREVGSDLSGRVPRKVDAQMLAQADRVVSMGCDDAVCDYPGRKVEDWSIEDPSGKPMARVREIRDEIRALVK